MGKTFWYSLKQFSSEITKIKRLKDRLADDGTTIDSVISNRTILRIQLRSEHFSSFFGT